MEKITLQQYANLIGYKGNSPTLEEIQEYAENEQDWTIWDYPLSELDYVKNEVQSDFVFVQVGDEVRICEV